MAFKELSQWETATVVATSTNRNVDMSGDVSFSLKGDFMTAQVMVNGKKVALAFNGIDTWKRKIANIPMEGPVQVNLKGIGPKGTTWQFKVYLEGRQVLNATGETMDDFLTRSWEIPIL